MLKKNIEKAIRSLVRKTRSNLKYTLLRVLKEVHSAPDIRNFADLEKIKYVGQKLYTRIQEEYDALSKAKEDGAFTTPPNYTQSILHEVREICNDIAHLSSNLSEMEIKYLDHRVSGDIAEISIYKSNPDSQPLSTFEHTQDLGNIQEHHTSSNGSILCISSESFPKPFLSGDDHTSSTGPLLSESHSILLNSVSDDSILPCNRSIKRQKHRKKARIPQDKHEYIPSYRSASYAILYALYVNHRTLHKSQIPSWASRFTDVSFERTQRFNGLSTLKVLQHKGLITLQNNRWWLTDIGQTLCIRMGCSKSVQLNDDTVYLVIDTREKKSRRDFLFFQKNLVNLNIQTRQLDLGDFVWIKNEKLFKYIVERKQATDFVQSISDGRYKLQVKKLLKLREFNVFYIIENTRHIQTSDALDKMCALKLVQIYAGNLFRLIETDCISGTLSFLKQLHSHILSVETAPTVGFGSFLDIVYSPVQSKENLLYEILLHIQGITAKSALRIAQVYTSLGTLLTKTKHALLQELLDLDLCGKKLPRGAAEQVVNLLF